MIFKYKNGNRLITINPSTGDKKRYKQIGSQAYKPVRPENIDLNLSYKCNLGCSFCYLNATPGKQVFNFDEEFLENLFKDDLVGLEIAMNLNDEPITGSHIALVKYLKNKNYIPNFTINYLTLKSKIDTYEFKQLKPYWWGVSVNSLTQIQNILKLVKDKSNISKNNIVFHIINGVFNPKEFIKIPKDVKVLVLGYKNLGRGVAFSPPYNFLTVQNIEQKGGNISFDNLAIKQIKDIETLPNFDLNYLGDDGEHSFYIDLVNKTFSKSSTDKLNNFKLGNKSVNECFKEVRNG